MNTNSDLAAVIMTGGASTRMGADKAARLWGDRRAVDRVADLARSAGCELIVTAGAGDYGYETSPDPSLFAGPVAGVLAAARRVAGRAGRLLILAVDAPTLTLEDLAPLLAAEPPGACYQGLPLPMLIGADTIPANCPDDWPLRRLVERAGLTQLALAPGATARARGANTPEEQVGLERLAGWSSSPLGSSEAP